jgi:hypothetical protein
VPDRAVNHGESRSLPDKLTRLPTWSGDQEAGDEVRLSAAEQLAAVDPRAAAPACLAIACDGEVGDEVRLSAAQLAALDPSA